MLRKLKEYFLRSIQMNIMLRNYGSLYEHSLAHGNNPGIKRHPLDPGWF